MGTPSRIRVYVVFGDAVDEMRIRIDTRDRDFHLCALHRLIEGAGCYLEYLVLGWCATDSESKGRGWSGNS